MRLIRRVTHFWIVAAGWSICASAVAGEMNSLLDCSADPRLFNTHFARYGYLQFRSIVVERSGVRIWLPSATPNIGQTGLYSFFALAGDFEYSVAYELLDVAQPQGGYGATCGIAIESEIEGHSVAIARGISPGNGSCYTVTRGQPGEEGVKYDGKFCPSTAKTGRLVLQRANDETVCLAADGMQEPRELCRIPFNNRTVRKVRIFADAGGSKTAVDGRFTQIRLRADEIAGGVPKLQPPKDWKWWWIGGGCGLATVSLVALRQRRLRRWPWSESD